MSSVSWEVGSQYWRPRRVEQWPDLEYTDENRPTINSLDLICVVCRGGIHKMKLLFEVDASLMKTFNNN